MKVILTSSGFTNEEIVKSCEELVGKPRAEINFLVLNEAIKAEIGDCRWFIDGLQEIAMNFGGNIELLDLQAHDLSYVRARIAECDVIFCFGGQTDYLKEVIEETKFVEILPEILEKKVWVGSSAGSCVLCYKEGKETSVGVFGETIENRYYLELLPICFLPHFRSTWFPQLTKDVALQESRNMDLPIYLMSDKSAIVVRGTLEKPEFRAIGYGYVVVEKGKIVEEKEETDTCYDRRMKKIITVDVFGGEHEAKVESLIPKVHVYGIAVQDGKALISSQFDGYDWPGGTFELGENTIETLRSEFKEETGYDVEPTKLLAIHTSFFHHLKKDLDYQSFLVFYAVKIVDGEISTTGFDADEREYASEAKWVDIDELHKMKHACSLDIDEELISYAKELV